MIFYTQFGNSKFNFFSAGLFGTGIIGFSNSFGRPGVQTFAIERQPQFAASVTSCFLFLNFGVFGFATTTIGPVLVNSIGLSLTYFILGCSILLASLLYIYEMVVWWGMGERIEKKHTPSPESGSSEN